MNPKKVFDLLKQTFTAFGEDKAPRLAAALAYYTVFSLAPLLVVVIAIAGLAFGQEAARGQITGQIQQLVGVTAAKAIQEILASASKPSSGIVATTIGVVTLLLGAAGVFGQLQDALNTVWGVAPKPGRSFWETIKDRFASFTMVLGVGFLLLVSLSMSTALSALVKYVSGVVPFLAVLGQVLDFVVSFGVVTLLFALLFKYLPDVKIGWRDVWMGAAMTALLFVVGKFAIGLYLGRSGVASAYGAAGSLVVLLLWVYYAAQILLFGAEFTKAYAKNYGSQIVPADDAVPVTPEARAEQGLKPADGPAAPGHSAPRHAQAPPGPPATVHCTPGMERDIQRAGLVGAALGLVFGLIRAPKR
jgi:membrane protein